MVATQIVSLVQIGMQWFLNFPLDISNNKHGDCSTATFCVLQLLCSTSVVTVERVFCILKIIIISLDGIISLKIPTVFVEGRV